MSQLEVDKIIPQSGTTLTIGDSGDTVNFADGTNLSIDTNTLYIDSTNNRVGIANASPSVALDVTGAAKVSGTLTVGDGHTIGNDGTFDNLLIQSSTGENIEYNSGLGSHIFKQNGTEVFRIDDTTGRVGIGLSNPTRPLTVFHSTLPILSLHNNTTGQNADDGFQFQLSSDDGYVWNYESSGNVIFGAGGAEAMRIDSSGNLLVANTTASSADAGHIFSPSGIAFHTRDGGIPLVLNRLTSDGEILRIRKDNTEVGSIGANSSSLYIAGTSKGFRFTASQLKPCDTSGANDDGNYDLGSSSTRFKDLYLGGGLYVGGTGSANKLDDYEEGTWTPTIATGGTDFSSVGYATQLGTYTKVGRTVIAHFQININALTVGSPSGNLCVKGLPFTSLNNSLAKAGTIAYVSNLQYAYPGFSAGNDSVNISGNVGANQSQFNLSRSRDNDTADGIPYPALTSTSFAIVGAAIYDT